MFPSQRFHSWAATSLPFQVFLMVISTARFSFSIDEAFCAPTPFSCGNITNISYPFWASGRPRECSYPGFELTCEGGVPQIGIGSHPYQVKSIDYEYERLTVVDMDFVGKTCPLPSINATTNFSLFEYAPIDINLTLYFNCPYPIYSPLSPLLCKPEGSIYPYAYFELQSGSDLGVYRFQDCDCGVISLHESHANFLKGDPGVYGDAVEDGFTLNWIVDQGKCGICAESGGQCGYNVTNPSEPICYCGGQSNYEKCPKSKHFWPSGYVIYKISTTLISPPTPLFI
ncbi:hypothetical protein ACLOJK_033067 [Asimina triloba]